MKHTHRSKRNVLAAAVLAALGTSAAARGGVVGANNATGNFLFNTDVVGPPSATPTFSTGSDGRLVGQLTCAGSSGFNNWPTLNLPTFLQSAGPLSLGLPPTTPTTFTTSTLAGTPVASFAAGTMGVGVTPAGLGFTGSVTNADVVPLSAATGAVRGVVHFTQDSGDPIIVGVRMAQLIAAPPGHLAEIGLHTESFKTNVNNVTIGEHVASIVAGIDGTPGGRTNFALGILDGVPLPAGPGVSYSITTLAPTVRLVEASFNYVIGNSVAGDDLRFEGTFTIAMDPIILARTQSLETASASDHSLLSVEVGTNSRSSWSWNNAGGGGSWESGSNWNSGGIVPESGRGINFGAAGIANGGSMVSVGADHSVGKLLFINPTGSYTIGTVAGFHTLSIGDSFGRGSIEAWNSGMTTINTNISGLNLNLLGVDPSSFLVLNGSLFAQQMLADGAGHTTLNGPSIFFNSLTVPNGFFEFGPTPRSLNGSMTVGGPAGAILQFDAATNANQLTVLSGGTCRFLGGINTINGTAVNNGDIIKANAVQLNFLGAYSGSGMLHPQDTGVSPSSTFAALIARSFRFAHAGSTSFAGIVLDDPINNDPIVSVDGPSTAVHLTGVWQGDGANSDNFLVVSNGGTFFTDAGSTLNTPGPGGLHVMMGNGATVNFGDEAPSVSIYVDDGASAKMIEGSTRHVTVGAMDDLRIGNGATLEVAGPGTLTVNGTQTYSPGATLKLTGGITIINTPVPAGLHIDLENATLKMDAEAPSVGLSVPADGDIVMDGANFTLEAGPGDNVSIGAAATLNKDGPGTLNIAGPQSHGTGATLKVNAGTVNMDSNGGPNLTITVDPSTQNFGANQTLNRLNINGGSTVRVGRNRFGANVAANLTAATLAAGAGGTNTLETTLPGNTAAATAAFNIAAGTTLNKQGPGALLVFPGAIQTHGAGAVLNVNGGSVTMSSDAGSAIAANLTLNVNAGAATFGSTQHLAALNLATGATATMTAHGATLVTGDITTTGTGKVDLKDNKLITQTAIGSWNGSAYTGVTGLIQSGRNGGGWGGSGIVTSQTDATSGNFTAIGVATAQQVKGLANAADTAVFAGQTVTGFETLVMYTYGGDANLDGKINVDDYGRIDFNVPLGTSGWFNGDFNYDGKINVDDYGIIDFNIGIQGPPFSTSGGLVNVAAVPEAGAGCAAALLLAALTPRRRRRD